MQRAIRISASGDAALLLDAAAGPFDVRVQQRIWAVARAARSVQGVGETVPGMNNLMVVIDPLAADVGAIEARLHELWGRVEPVSDTGRLVEIPVTYGGAAGEDLPEVARQFGMAVAEVIARHSGATYLVGAVGAMPGFPYLAGLDPRLTIARRTVPRGLVAQGSVMIGGAQAGIMPCTAPSGWHILGRTPVKLFDPAWPQPALLRAGDRVRFLVAGVEP